MSDSGNALNEINEVAELDVQDKKSQDQHYRLGGRSPLKTILLLTIGPIMSSSVGALYGFFNSLWGSNYLGEIVMVAIGVEQVFENIGRSFGQFQMVACSTQISKLFGEKKSGEAGQVMCDMIRMSVIFGIIVPVIILPVHDITARWFGASDEVVKAGFSYILPISAGSMLTCFNLCCQGALQAEGRTLLVGCISLASVTVSMGALVPFFIFVCKLGIRSCALAYLMADAIPGMILLVLFFCGVFNTKPKLKQLLCPFSKNSYQAMVVGLSQLIANLAFVIPGIPIRKVIGDCCSSPAQFDLVMAGFNIAIRYQAIAGAIVLAVTVGYTPCASYAISSKNYKRYIKLTMWAAILSGSWCALATSLSRIIPTQIASIFSDDPNYIEYGSNILYISNSAGWINFIRFVFTAMLQTQQLGGRAMILSFLSNFLLLIMFTYILYFTNKHDPVRIFWNNPMTSIGGVVVGVPLIAGPFLKVWRLSKEQDKGEVDSIEQELNVGDVDEAIAHERESAPEIKTPEVPTEL